MRTLQIHYKYNYKHKLLYCLLLNYCRRSYSKTKFKGVIAVACFKRPALMNHYEMFYNTIKELTVDDIKTLRKFVCKRDDILETLFEELDNNDISYIKILDDIKTTYTKDKSLCCDEFNCEEPSIPKDKNAIFTEIESLIELYDKYLIKDIFIPEFCTKAAIKSNSSSLITMLINYIEEFRKMKEILRVHGIINDNLSNLNLFIETDDGMLLLDEVYECINGDV